MKRAMERHEQEEAYVIPIILRPVYWRKTPFGKLQALPSDGKPIISSHWNFQDEALFDVAEGIRITVEDMVSKDNAKHCVDKGNMLREQKQYIEALRAYEEALQQDTKCFQAYHYQGEVYNILHQYENAIAAFDKAVEIKPKAAETYKNMGEVLIQLKRYNEATKVLRRALGITPNDKDLEKSISALLDVINEIRKAQQLCT